MPLGSREWSHSGTLRFVKREKPFDLQGHRGARGLRPENTLAAFSHALSLGVSTLELDTAITRDGIVVVSHDSRLNPDITRGENDEWLTTPGPTIFSMTYAEILRYDVGRLRPGSAYAARFPDQLAVDGEGMPRLTDVFSLTKRAGDTRVRFNIETKINPLAPDMTATPEAFTAALVKEIRLARVADRATIQSFDWRTLMIARRIAPEIATVCLTTQQPGEDTVCLGASGLSPWLGGLDVRHFDGSVPRLVRACHASAWSPNHLDLDTALIEEAHSLGLDVIPWTVNDPLEMARFIDMGVDGLITDRPDALREIVVRKGRHLSRQASIP